VSVGFLLDTNCISEIVRIQPEPRVVKWMKEADEQSLYLCVLTLGEIRKGIAPLPAGKRRSQLENWLDVDLRQRFAGRILPIDEAVAERWGVLVSDMKRNGTPVPTIDAIIAATALHHNLTVVSRNVGDFRYAQVTVFNPWETP
jgi:toxin FitB